MSAPLWSGDKLIAALRARPEGAVPPVVTGASIDTRTLEPGDVFFAITGEARDGHDFVRGALDKGAALAVIDEAHAAEFEGAGALAVVPDVLKAMEHAGTARRAELKAGIVAVTGSVGRRPPALARAVPGERRPLPAPASSVEYACAQGDTRAT